MAQASIQGTDSNSLLRLHDHVHALFSCSRSQHERTRAEKAMQRITHELQERNVRP